MERFKELLELNQIGSFPLLKLSYDRIYAIDPIQERKWT